MSAVPADAAVPTCTIYEAAHRVLRWWRATRGGVNLGFSRRSVIGRVMDEGCQGAAHAGAVRPMTYMDEADEEVDRIIASMPKELRDALVLAQDRNLPTKVIAAKMHATPAEVRRAIEHAYGFVAGALTVANSSR